MQDAVPREGLVHDNIVTVRVRRAGLRGTPTPGEKRGRRGQEGAGSHGQTSIQLLNGPLFNKRGRDHPYLK